MDSQPPSPPATAQPKTKKQVTQRSSFMARLHHAVTTSPDPDLLRFNDKGDGIIVSKDGPAVCSLLLNAGMDYKTWDSVVRQLNYWRFKRSSEGDGRKKRNKSTHHVFEHELVGHFRAGPTSLHNEVKRRQRTRKTTDQASNGVVVKAAAVESSHSPTPSGSNSELPPASPSFALDHDQRLHHNDETSSTSKSPSHSPQFSHPGSFAYSSTPAAYEKTYEASPSLDHESLDSAVLNSPIQPLPPVLKSRSRQLGLGGPHEDTNHEKTPSTPVHFLSLPIPSLNITPASPVISRDNDYLPFSVDETSQHQQRAEEEKSNQVDFTPSNEKTDYFANPSYDNIPLSSTSPSSSESTIASAGGERRKSFPRYLHPEDLPPLHTPPPSDDRKRKRRLLCIRLSLLISIIGLALGLGVGLSQPNRSATSTNVGGVAPPQMSGATQSRSVNTVPAWTKLATSSSESESQSAIVPSSTKLANVGLPPKAGGGGVQLHQGEVQHGVKNAQKQRRKLRQFGTGTVAGWR
ncbi:hypothetical protein JCM5353_003549 [Sporobolomyces roseus]